MHWYMLNFCLETEMVPVLTASCTVTRTKAALRKHSIFIDNSVAKYEAQVDSFSELKL